MLCLGCLSCRSLVRRYNVISQIAFIRVSGFVRLSRMDLLRSLLKAAAAAAAVVVAVVVVVVVPSLLLLLLSLALLLLLLLLKS